MFLGYIAQGTCTAEVAYRVARCMAEHIVGNADKRIFLAEHTSVLTDKRKTVYIRIDNNTKTELAATHTLHYTAEILLQRFRIMGKIASRFAIKYFVINAQCLKQFGQDDASHAVDSINTYAEMCLLYSLNIYKAESQHRVYVATVERVVFYIMAESVYIGILKVFLFCNVKHFVAGSLVEKLALTVEQLKGIPLTRP